jgi:hypothetical protein
MDNIIDMRALLDGVEPLTLSLWMCALLLLLVLIGVRVAFAAAFVGIVGLCLYFMQRQGFDRGLVTALKLAGQVPHSKSSGYALSLIPTFILIGYLAYYAGLTTRAFRGGQTLDRLGAGRAGGFHRLRHRGLRRRLGRVGGHGSGLCPHRHPRDAQDRL